MDGGVKKEGIVHNREASVNRGGKGEEKGGEEVDRIKQERGKEKKRGKREDGEREDEKTEMSRKWKK